MSNIKKHVESLLKNHSSMIRELKVLEFEMKNLSMPLASEIIEGLVFSHTMGERVSGSFISDKTANIAIEHVDSQRNAKYRALSNVIFNIRQEVRRLEHCLSLLPKEEEEVIRWFYFDALSWDAITDKTLVTQKTMQRRKKRGFEKLVSYYSIVDKLSDQSSDICMKTRFISYVHEEQYSQCLKRVRKEHQTPGIAAMLYIISGCTELWNAGVDTLFNFKEGKPIPQEAITDTYSVKGAKLFRLAYCYAYGVKLDQKQLLHMLQNYFSGLEQIHLELAIEAMRIALFSDI